MIVYEGAGDLLDYPASTITIPINVVGAMGKGLALAARKAIPGLYDFYLTHYPKRQRGNRWDDLVRTLQVYEVPDSLYKVLLFPTKRHWREASQVSWIERNLETLARDYEKLGIHSLALSPLGCGLGGLTYTRDVRPLIYRYLDPLPLAVRVITKVA